MFHIKIFFVLIVVCFSDVVTAVDVNCPAGKVKYIQVQNYNVLVLQEGQFWRAVGKHSEPSTDAKLSVLLTAQASNRKVQLRYPEGFDCSKTDYGTSTLAVRIYD